MICQLIYPSKIFLSETERSKGKTFCVQHRHVVLYQYSSNYAPGVKVGPLPEVIIFIHIVIQGNTLKSFLAETKWPRAQVFGVQHCLGALYKHCSTCSPGVKMCPAQGVTCFTQRFIEKPLKSSCLKPKGLQLRQLVCSIVQQSSSKIVNIMPWSKLGFTCLTQRDIGNTLNSSYQKQTVQFPFVLLI